MNWTQPAFEAVARRLSARTGLAFGPDRRPAAELGIRRAMARAGVADPVWYAVRLDEDPAAFDDLIVELTVGETYFFREPAQFQFLRAVVLPELSRRRGPEHPIRAWSAGCASGEEAYSLAMLFADEGLSAQGHVLATDISRAALARAREGRYTTWSLRGEGADQARPHLRRVGDRFVVADAPRRRVAFESLNLATDAYPSYATGTCGLDLIFCRNVLIYFDRETVSAVARRLFESLAPGGWLLTASSDPPLGSEAPFESVITEYGVFHRRPAVEWGLPISEEPSVRFPPPPPNAVVREGAVAFAPVELPRTHPLSEGDGEETRFLLPVQPRDVRGEGGGILAPTPTATVILASAREDLGQGLYARAAERARELAGDHDADALHVRALANIDLVLAERAAADAAARHPLSGELHYLRAVLLLGLEREGEAARSARRALYLDRSLAIAHFLLGSILRRQGDRLGAWRAYRNARDLCTARPADEAVPLSDGEPAGRLAELARLQLEHLQPDGEERS